MTVASRFNSNPLVSLVGVLYCFRTSTPTPVPLKVPNELAVVVSAILSRRFLESDQLVTLDRATVTDMVTSAASGGYELGYEKGAQDKLEEVASLKKQLKMARRTLTQFGQRGPQATNEPGMIC